MSGKSISQQLCWSCRNAVPSATNGCEWSEELRPVPGWDAQLVKKATFGVTWSIRGCPKYHADETREELGY